MLYVRETLDPDFTILRYETFCYPQVSPPEKEAVEAARPLRHRNQRPTPHLSFPRQRTGSGDPDGKQSGCVTFTSK